MVLGEEDTTEKRPVLASHQALRDSPRIIGDIHLDYSVGVAPARSLPGTGYYVPLSILGHKLLVGLTHTPEEGKSPSTPVTRDLQPRGPMAPTQPLLKAYRSTELTPGALAPACSTQGPGRVGESLAEHRPLVKSLGEAARLEDRWEVCGNWVAPLSPASPLPTAGVRDAPASPLGNSGVQRARRPGGLSGAGMIALLRPTGFWVMRPTHKETQPGGRERAALLVTGRVSEQPVRHFAKTRCRRGKLAQGNSYLGVQSLRGAWGRGGIGGGLLVEQNPGAHVHQPTTHLVTGGQRESGLHPQQ